MVHHKPCILGCFVKKKKKCTFLYPCVDTDYDVFDVICLRWFQLSFFKLYSFGNRILNDTTVKHLQHK